MKGTFNIKIFIEEIHRQVDLTNGSFSFKPLHFVHTLHMQHVFIVCFPGLERKISVRTSKEELIQRGILLPAEVRFYFSITIDYFWLLLILVVAVCYGLLLIVYYP